tara:strand:+ start:711 stop:842 length:132 start_codon:yes stop_codon:yes gene_type:complete
MWAGCVKMVEELRLPVQNLRSNYKRLGCYEEQAEAKEMVCYTG